MREAIRCCIACILPCGVLDVVRIVHSNGKVEEISYTVRASDIMEQYPKHVLRKPPSTLSFEQDNGTGDVDKLYSPVILHPTAELERGKIYFLAPVTSSKEKLLPDGKGGRKRSNQVVRKDASVHIRKDSKSEDNVSFDRYLTEILSEKASSTQNNRRRGRVRVWRPHLESISEQLVYLN
ncbi:hypothetical protein ZOSMA_117G00520 [Zostera marina]|uniref:Uncharacterized protein n=1 Tax=Zostera marina TaxID=29655 RepID=A0A0K9Q1V4_ZOSMR|nr:hypothetical protein ZOSMA_117G00520 [Zostera marina]